MQIEWYTPKDIPDEFSKAENGLTIDVLVYCISQKIHTIGWYNYNELKWYFLLNEHINKDFKWRYFTDIDFPEKISKKIKK